MHSKFDTPYTAHIEQFTDRGNVPPCPFCGSTFLRVHVGHEPHVSCMQCGTDGPRPARTKDNPDAALLAIKAWCARIMGDMVNQLRQRARDINKLSKYSIDWALHNKSADEIERQRAEADTAFLRGVKAGLEAAAKLAENQHKVWYEDPNNGVECDVTACQNIADAVRALDPTTIKPVTEE